MAPRTDSADHRDGGNRYQLTDDTARRVAAWQRQRVADLRRLPVAMRVAMLRDAFASDLSQEQGARDRAYLHNLTNEP